MSDKYGEQPSTEPSDQKRQLFSFSAIRLSPEGGRRGSHRRERRREWAAGTEKSFRTWKRLPSATHCCLLPCASLASPLTSTPGMVPSTPASSTPPPSKVSRAILEAFSSSLYLSLCARARAPAIL